MAHPGPGGRPERAGWRLVVIAKVGCSFSDAVTLIGDKRRPSCDAWAPRALEAIRSMRPEVVVTVTRSGQGIPRAEADGATAADYDPDAMVEGLVTYWNQIVAAGSRLVPLLDTPYRSGDVPRCVQENQKRLSECGFPEETGASLSGAPAQLAAAAKVPDARVLDLTKVVCPDGSTCPPVIGNVLVYRGGSHLSDTYAASTAKVLGTALADATDGLLAGT